MHGNILEWCADWYGTYPKGILTDPVGPSSGSARVRRGGSYIDGAGECRSALRDEFEPSRRDLGLGFRLAPSVPSGR
jgi:formylglycine-generating enzyme